MITRYKLFMVNKGKIYPFMPPQEDPIPEGIWLDEKLYRPSAWRFEKDVVLLKNAWEETYPTGWHVYVDEVDGWHKTHLMRSVAYEVRENKDSWYPIYRIVEISYRGKIEDIIVSKPVEDVELEWTCSEGKARILMWSPRGHYIPKGKRITMRISGAKDLKLEKADVADRYGNTLSIERKGASLSLLKIEPNPSGKAVKIQYVIGEEADVNLSIYDVSGRLVKKLKGGRQKAGSYTVIWNGRDERNRTVSNGVYFLKVNAGKFKQTRKIILMR